MIRVKLGKRLKAKARDLTSDQIGELNSTLSAVAAQFGDVHSHAGLGVRKIGRRLYEARVGIKLRIVFVHRADDIVAYDLMSHDEVIKWLRNQN